MAHGSLPEEFVGCWRSEVGWIGGASPTQAVFVPAPPSELCSLMGDLLGTADRCPGIRSRPRRSRTRSSRPSIRTQTATAVSEVLALWLLARHLENVIVPPPMSVLIARDTDSYLAALGAFRIGMDDRLVGWFASILTSASHASGDRVERLDSLVQDWERRTSGLGADATGRRILPVLARFPVLSAGIAAEQLDVSLPAARNGLNALVEIGILDDLDSVASGPGRPRRWWSAPELLDLVSAWSI
jgi:DNA-binding transcriptional ArsR family regulator